MSDRTFQAALAALLVSEDDRKLLLREPHRLRDRFELSAQEIHLLATASHARIELGAWTVASKRLEFLHRALPVTMRLLDARCHDPRLMQFLERCPPVDTAEDRSRIVAEGCRFLEYVSRERPAWAADHVKDVARYELMTQQLVFSTEASLAAAECEKQQEERRRRGDDGPIEARFVLGRHVAVERFACDVMATVQEFSSSSGVTTPTPRPSAVALRKTPAGPVVPYRLGEATYEMLSAWRTPRPMPDPEGPFGQSRLSAARFALQEGFLMTSP